MVNTEHDVSNFKVTASKAIYTLGCSWLNAYCQIQLASFF